MRLNKQINKQINRCRLCKSNNLSSLFTLGDQCVSNFVSSSEDAIRCPINLILCQNCTLVQLEHTAPQEILYSRKYWYRSGVTDTMRQALRDITKKAESLVDLDSGDIVLDIGSNDGTLLRSYSREDLFTVGVEPANNLIEEGSKGITLFLHDFWDSESYIKAIGESHYKAKVITAIGMFYDLDDPIKFVSDISKVLMDDGIFIAQLMCLQDMLDINDLGNFAHEHLEFYSMRSLLFLMQAAGLEIIDLETNSVNGKSTRIIARKKQSTVTSITSLIPPSVLDRLEKEKELDHVEFYDDFYSKLETNKKHLVEFIKNAVKSGKRVWVYGASTKGNVILQWCGLDHTLIEAAADRSPEKWGLKTVGTDIPIVSEEIAREENPDYFLILPYAFLHEFIKREEEWLRGGGIFIVPLPEFRLVGYE
jgi:NDP-4-keto-2,6-dideoxyhexose 3-C-methyltransferase